MYRRDQRPSFQEIILSSFVAKGETGQRKFEISMYVQFTSIPSFGVRRAVGPSGSKSSQAGTGKTKSNSTKQQQAGPNSQYQ